MKKILPVLLLQFVNGMWFALFIPVFPFLVEWFGQGEIFYGLLLASYSVCQFFASPLFWRLSDKYGRRNLLIGSQFGTLLSYGIFLLALWYWLEWASVFLGVSSILRWVLFSRIVDGITGGNSSVANAYLSDVTSMEEKTKMFGLMGAMIGLAMIIGPAMWSWSMTRGIWFFGPVLLWWAISLVVLLMLIFSLPESLDEQDRNTSPIAYGTLLSATKRFEVLKDYPDLKKRFILYAWFGLMFVWYTSTIVFYFKDVLLLGPEQIWYLFAFVGLFLIFHMAVTVKKATTVRDDKKMFLIWLSILSLSFIAFVFTPNLYRFLFISFFLDAWLAFVMSSFKGLITKQVSWSEQGTITGLEESVMAANRAITPIIATAVYSVISVWFYPAFGVLWIGLVFRGSRGK